IWHVPDSTPAGIGGIDEYTVLMMHMDGDQSDSNHTFEILGSGNASISNIQSKFGNTSLYMETTRWAFIPDSPDWDFGTGNFTVDGWFYGTSKDTTDTLFSISAILPQNHINVYSVNGTNIYWQYYNGSTWLSEDTGTVFTLNTWHHIAMVRNSTNFDLYLDGISIGNFTLPAEFSFATDNGVRLGDNGSGTATFTGYIDEFRISNTARWTSNFNGSLPASAYASDTNTKLLVHMDGDVSNSNHVVSLGGSPRLNATTA
ncbi:unnamed protein product, partial [marine sediment metagenome]